MNKPAPKEPSMDEILSSIRQIIADDDAAATPRRSTPEPAASAASASSGFTPPPPAMRPIPPVESLDHDFPALDDEEEAEPLTLSPAQILQMPDTIEPETFSSSVPTFEPPRAAASEAARPAAPEPARFAPPEPARAIAPEPVSGFSTPTLVDPEDVSFDLDDDAEEPEPVAYEPPPVPRREQPVPPRPATRIADAAPMPDRNLSRDLTEQLIEPATNAAVRQNLQRLNALHIAVPGMTIESMVREMLRPMLKDWLDENLPAMVERMVEKEIARISRGVD